MKYIYLKILTWLAQIRVDRAMKRAERASERANAALAGYARVYKKLAAWNEASAHATPHPENIPVIGDNGENYENDPEARDLQQKIQKSFEFLFCTPREEE